MAMLSWLGNSKYILFYYDMFGRQSESIRKISKVTRRIFASFSDEDEEDEESTSSIVVS